MLLAETSVVQDYTLYACMIVHSMCLEQSNYTNMNS